MIFLPEPFLDAQPRGALCAFALLLVQLVSLPGSLSAGVQGECTPRDSALVLDTAQQVRCAGHSAIPLRGTREDQRDFPCLCVPLRRREPAGAGLISAAFVRAAALGVRSPARACLLIARPRGVAAANPWLILRPYV